MSRYNQNNSLSILSLLLLTIVSFQNSSAAFTRGTAFESQEFKTEEQAKFDSKKIVNKLDYTKALNWTNVNDKVDIIALNKAIDGVTLQPDVSKKNGLRSSELDANKVSFNVFTGRNPEDNNPLKDSNPIVDLIRRTALFFFLILFVPLGLFYPFYLFYKQLYAIDQKNSSTKNADLEATFFNRISILEEKSEFSDLQPLKSETKSLKNTEDSRVNFSLLQIAFYPEGSNFKQQLSLINSSRDRNAGEMMHKTISLLITQQDWTHVNSHCISTSIKEARKKFEEVLFIEQDKYMNRKLSLVNGQQQLNKSQAYASGTSDRYKYTVVTMLFCTFSDFSLAENITTKEDLAEQLIKLSAIDKKDIVKFELLWNPQNEGEFVSNEELLTDYDRMTRLL